MGEIKQMQVDHVHGYAFVAKGGSNHYMVIDSKYRGQPASANGPMEMVLAALGSCSGSDVVEILQKKRQKIDRFSIHLSGERVEEYPRVFKRIQMKYIFHGKQIDRKAIEHAIELSLTKYCSVHGMLSKSVEITHEFEIIESSG